MFEKVVAFVVYEDEGGEILYFDFPDGLHAKFGIFYAFYALDVVLSKYSAGPPIEPLSERRVATFNRLQNDSTQNAGELLLRYKRDGNKISFGAEHFFFNTDSVEKYQQAEYGLIKVDDKGRCSLVGVCDNDKRLIE